MEPRINKLIVDTKSHTEQINFNWFVQKPKKQFQFSTPIRIQHYAFIVTSTETLHGNHKKPENSIFPRIPDNK